MLTSEVEIGAFLKGTARYYRQVNCRFDYGLFYKTDRDYRYARERFEQYFYPAQRKLVP